MYFQIIISMPFCKHKGEKKKRIGLLIGVLRTNDVINCVGKTKHLYEALLGGGGGGGSHPLSLKLLRLLSPKLLIFGI